MKSLEECKRWLSIRGVLTVFLQYVRREGKTIERLYERYGSEMIDGAFAWSETPEGRTFWKEISEQFEDWYDSNNAKILQPKSLFKIAETVIVADNLSNYIVDVDEEMNNLSNKKVTIIDIDHFGYSSENENQDGCFYYIKEDSGIHSWINSMFKKQ